MIRETIANSLIAAGRLVGKMSGLELAVELSDHSIEAKMEQPDTDKRAWDPTLYKSGNLFISGYANPIKPQVTSNQDLDTPDTVDVREGESDENVDDPQLESADDEDEPHAYLITSGRYREYMRQDLISQLLTPESRWNLLVWAVVGLGALLFFNMILMLWATGSF